MSRTSGRAPVRSPKRARGAASKSDTRATAIILAATAGMVVVAVAVVLAYSAFKDDPTTVAQFRPVQVEGGGSPTGGGPLPAFAAGGGPDAAVGQSAPVATGSDFEGKPDRLVHEGTPTMIVFAAHWCPHCQAELPVLTEWIERGGNKGVDPVVVATGTSADAPNYPPSAWLEDIGWPGRTIVDDESSTLARAYGLKGYPLIVFVDANGKVTKRLAGEVPVSDLDAAVASIGGS